MKKRFWKIGIENQENYLNIFLGLFTLHFCRCGQCRVPLILENVREVRSRKCGFCFKEYAYEQIPDDSIVYLDILACAGCLKKDKTKVFRELVREAEWER